MNLSENFTVDELACKCCGVCRVTPELLAALEALRAKAGPLIPTSGYRCPKHNKAVGGSQHSRHMRGMAADVHPVRVTPMALALLAFSTPGIRGVGLDEERGFVHVDVRHVPARWKYAGGREVLWT